MLFFDLFLSASEDVDLKLGSSLLAADDMFTKNSPLIAVFCWNVHIWTCLLYISGKKFHNEFSGQFMRCFCYIWLAISFKVYDVLIYATVNMLNILQELCWQILLFITCPVLSVRMLSGWWQTYSILALLLVCFVLFLTILKCALMKTSTAWIRGVWVWCVTI